MALEKSARYSHVHAGRPCLVRRHKKKFAITMNDSCPDIWSVTDGIQDGEKILRNYADNDDSGEFAMRPGDSAKQTYHKSVQYRLEGGADVKNVRIGILDGCLEVFPMGKVHTDEFLVAGGDHLAIRLNDKNGADPDH